MNNALDYVNIDLARNIYPHEDHISQICLKVAEKTQCFLKKIFESLNVFDADVHNHIQIFIFQKKPENPTVGEKIFIDEKSINGMKVLYSNWCESYISKNFLTDMNVDLCVEKTHTAPSFYYIPRDIQNIIITLIGDHICYNDTHLRVVFKINTPSDYKGPPPQTASENTPQPDTECEKNIESSQDCDVVDTTKLEQFNLKQLPNARTLCSKEFPLPPFI